MPKYWVKNYFAHRRFPEVRKKERKLVKTMAKLRMAHPSTHGARKPPGPKCIALHNHHHRNNHNRESIQAPLEMF